MSEKFSPDALETALAAVRENNRKLSGCSQHDFMPKGPTERACSKLLTCSRCGGKATLGNVLWYERGILHALGDSLTE